jgi:hypothetical protein
MIYKIIILLFILLFIFIIYKIYYAYKYSNHEFNTIKKIQCLDTRFGCCKDKITPKLDENGTNCRGF